MTETALSEQSMRDHLEGVQLIHNGIGILDNEIKSECSAIGSN